MAIGSRVLGQPSRSGLVHKLVRSPCLPLRVSPRSVRIGRARKVTPPTAYFEGVDPVGASGVVKIATMLLTSASVAIGALLLSQQFILEQDLMERGEACPACGGSGYEPCFCNRWSDGDVGCNSCGHTGFARCKDCGGGGTAVPVPIAIRKDGSPPRMR